MKMKRLVRRVLPPLVVIGLLAGSAFYSSSSIETGIKANSTALLRAEEQRYAATEIFRLVLQQDDSTKSMIIAPENISEVADVKIQSFDAQQALMRNLEEIALRASIKSQVRALKSIEETKLRRLDERLLEELLSGNEAAAKKLFFEEYAPARAEYAKVVAQLAAEAKSISDEAKLTIEAEVVRARNLLWATFTAIGVLFLAVVWVEMRRAQTKRSMSKMALLVELSLRIVRAATVEELAETVAAGLGLSRPSQGAGLPPALEMWLQVADSGLPQVWKVWQEGTEMKLAEPSVHLEHSLFHSSGRLVAPLALGSGLLGGIAYLVPSGTEESPEEVAFYQSLGLAIAQALQALQDKEKREHDANVIARKERDMRLVLESMSDSVAAVDKSGFLTGTWSRAFVENFPRAERGVPLSSLLFHGNERSLAGFRVLFAQLWEDVLPFEFSASQLPSRVKVTGKTFDVTYAPVLVEETLHEVLVSMKDVSEKVHLEEKEARSKDLLAFLESALEAPSGTIGFLTEMNRLLSIVQQGTALNKKQALHTLKGTSAAFGLSRFSRLCHESEEELLAKGDLGTSSQKALTEEWEFLAQQAHRILGGLRSDGVSLSRAELQRLAAQACQLPGGIALARALEELGRDSVHEKLQPLRRQAQVAAERLGKPILVKTQVNVERVPNQRFDSFFAGLVHVVRNAVDHGIEPPSVRTTLGKADAGQLVIQADFVGETEFVVAVQDDGAGIDWDRLRDKARRSGLAWQSEDDLVAALFQDGISTRDEATELSGRGIGLSAVKLECERLGGRVAVETKPGRGTTFLFRFPRTLLAG